ncbi:MAG: hypothetical protein HN757_18265 [Calditrichaeota bacterium]|jgi:hypothetical protein|nr:hypothetical protein [Calditrichota bacterium]
MKVKVRIQYLNKKELLMEEFQELVIDYISATAGLNVLGRYFFKNSPEELMKWACAAGVQDGLFKEFMDVYHKSIVEEMQECKCSEEEKKDFKIENEDGSLNVPDLIH